MKKIIASLTALALVFTLLAGINASAVKNLLPVTEEISEIYPGSDISDLEQNNAWMGSYSDLPGAAGGNYADLGIVGKDETIKKLGNCSLKVHNQKTGCSTIIVLVRDLKKNSDYTLQAWVKTDKVISLDWGAGLSINFYNEKSASLGESYGKKSENLTGTKDWKRVSLTLKTPDKDFAYAFCCFYVWGGMGTAWFDCIALTEGNAAVDDANLENPSDVPILTVTPTQQPTATPAPAAYIKNLLKATDETNSKFGDILSDEELDKINGAYWSFSSVGTEKPTISNDMNVKKFGNQSFKIYLNSLKVENLSSILMIKVPRDSLTENKTYTLQCWIKTDNLRKLNRNFDFYYYQLSVFNPNEKKVWLQLGTNDWTKYRITFMAPKNGTPVYIKLGTSAIIGTVWVDGLALVESDNIVDDNLIEGMIPTPAETTTPEVTPPASTDIPSSWAKAEVDEAIAAKLVPSALQSKYTSSITRSDFCDLVVNMIEVKSGKKIADFVKEKTEKDLSDKPFPDTSSANVNAASKLGIVNGRTNGNFDPDGLITRQEAAKMLALTAKALGADVTASAASFTDGAKIAAWAKEYVNFVFAKGVMAGTGNNNFSPAASYTREQSFLTILRLSRIIK